MANIGIDPILLSDFSAGVLRNVSQYKKPQNSVSYAINLVFDEVVGEAWLRKGTTAIGQVVDNKNILGLVNFRRRGDSNHRLLIMVNDATDTNADLYKLD